MAKILKDNVKEHEYLDKIRKNYVCPNFFKHFEKLLRNNFGVKHLVRNIIIPKRNN